MITDVSTENESVYSVARRMLTVIEMAGIDPGQMLVTPSKHNNPYTTICPIQFHVFYSDSDQREACDALVSLLFGTDFEYEVEKNSFAYFTGLWWGVLVQITASGSAGYKKRGQGGA